MCHTKEPHYVNLHLLILQFSMSFIRMDLLGPHNEIENRNQNALTVICMFMDCIFMIPFKSKTTEEFIKAYLKDVYSSFRGNQCILNDRRDEFTSKQFTWLAQESGFTKIYTSPDTPTSNVVIERTHVFLKTSLGKSIYNHNTDWRISIIYYVWMQHSHANII